MKLQLRCVFWLTNFVLNKSIPPAAIKSAVVDDLECRDEAESHAEAQETAGVGHEPDQGDLLIPLDAGHHGILQDLTHLIHHINQK